MYCRKIVIVSGQDRAYENVKGILTFSTEKEGVCVKMSLYHLTAAEAKYRVILECERFAVSHSFSAKGLADEVFMTDLPLAPTDKIHVLIGFSETGKPVAYGSNDGVPMWESGLVSKLLDDVRQSAPDDKNAAVLPPEATAVCSGCDGISAVRSAEKERSVSGASGGPTPADSADPDRRAGIPEMRTALRSGTPPETRVPFMPETEDRSRARGNRNGNGNFGSGSDQRSGGREGEETVTIRQRFSEPCVTDADDGRNVRLPRQSERSAEPTVVSLGSAVVTPSSAPETADDGLTEFERVRARARAAYDDERVADYNYYPKQWTADPIDRRDAHEEAAAARTDAWGGYRTAERPRLRPKSREEDAAQPPVPPKYYLSVKGALDALFKTGRTEEVLNRAMQGTRWVRVPYRAGQHYCVGLIGTSPDYIGYAVPGVFELNPPRQLAGLSKWLPRSSEQPRGEGYWVMFQDARTGASVRLD